MCLLVMRYLGEVSITFSSVVDASSLSLWVSENGSPFRRAQEINSGSRISSGSIQYPIPDEYQPGKVAFKVIHSQGETPVQSLNLDAKDFGPCGYEGDGQLLHFTLP